MTASPSNRHHSSHHKHKHQHQSPPDAASPQREPLPTINPYHSIHTRPHTHLNPHHNAKLLLKNNEYRVNNDDRILDYLSTRHYGDQWRAARLEYHRPTENHFPLPKQDHNNNDKSSLWNQFLQHHDEQDTDDDSLHLSPDSPDSLNNAEHSPYRSMQHHNPSSSAGAEAFGSLFGAQHPSRLATDPSCKTPQFLRSNKPSTASQFQIHHHSTSSHLHHIKPRSPPPAQTNAQSDGATGEVVPYDRLSQHDKTQYNANLEMLRLSSAIHSLKISPGTSQAVPHIVSHICNELVTDTLLQTIPQLVNQKHTHNILTRLIEEILIEIIVEEKEFVPPSNSDLQLYDSIFSGGRRNEVLVSGYSVNMTRDLMRCLDRTSWLNDEVINFYYKLMEDRNKRQIQKFPHLFPKVYFCNTFFYEKLMQRGYEYAGVRRWTRKVDLFTYDKIIFPLHLSVHWTLAVFDLRKHQLVYYDSMLSSPYKGQSILNDLERYIHDEYRDKKGGASYPHQITKHVVSNIPQQHNGYDCGVFACKFANFICQDLEFTFDQRHMSYFRKRMAVEILRKSIL